MQQHSESFVQCCNFKVLIMWISSHPRHLISYIFYSQHWIFGLEELLAFSQEA